MSSALKSTTIFPGATKASSIPEEKLRAIRAVAEKAHQAGNYAFVYIAGTECITAKADPDSAHPGQGASRLAAAKDYRRAGNFRRRHRLLDQKRRRGCLGQPVRDGVAQDLHGAGSADCGHRH